MVSGSYDRVIRMWSLETGEEIWHAERTDKGRAIPGGNSHWPLGFTNGGKAVVLSLVASPATVLLPWARSTT